MVFLKVKSYLIFSDNYHFLLNVLHIGSSKLLLYQKCAMGTTYIFTNIHVKIYKKQMKGYLKSGLPHFRLLKLCGCSKLQLKPRLFFYFSCLSLYSVSKKYFNFMKLGVAVFEKSSILKLKNIFLKEKEYF